MTAVIGLTCCHNYSHRYSSPLPCNHPSKGIIRKTTLGGGGWGGAIHAQTRIQEAHYIIDKQATQLFLATASQRGKDMTLKPHGLAMNFGFNVIKHGRQQHNMTILLKPINSIKIQLLAEIFFWNIINMGELVCSCIGPQKNTMFMYNLSTLLYVTWRIRIRGEWRGGERGVRKKKAVSCQSDTASCARAHKQIVVSTEHGVTALTTAKTFPKFFFYKNKFVRRDFVKLPRTGNLKSGTILQVGGLVKMALWFGGRIKYVFFLKKYLTTKSSIQTYPHLFSSVMYKICASNLFKKNIMYPYYWIPSRYLYFNNWTGKVDFRTM